LIPYLRSASKSDGKIYFIKLHCFDKLIKELNTEIQDPVVDQKNTSPNTRTRKILVWGMMNGPGA
jgi:hypothetical protein